MKNCIIKVLPVTFNFQFKNVISEINILNFNFKNRHRNDFDNFV